MADHPGPLDEELTAARDVSLLADPVQLELIRDAVPGRDAGTAVAINRKRGPGRPPGALNRRNAKFRDQILAMGPHPALALQRAATTPVDVLAAQLQCSLHEAALIGIRAAAELLPYLEGKQPTVVELRQHHDGILILPGGPTIDGGQLQAIADQVNAEAEEIDWDSATVEDLPRLGEPLRDVPPSEAEQSGDAG